MEGEATAIGGQPDAEPEARSGPAVGGLWEAIAPRRSQRLRRLVAEGEVGHLPTFKHQAEPDDPAEDSRATSVVHAPEGVVLPREM